MKIERLVDIINDYIYDVRSLKGILCNSFIVLHKSILPGNTSFKAIKSYKVELSIVEQDKVPIMFYTNSRNFNSTLVENDEAFEELSAKLLIHIMHMIRDNSFDNIINGTYKYETN